MKKLTIVWTIFLIVIVASLTIFGLCMKNAEKSNIMEESLTKKSEQYLNLFVSKYPRLGNQIKITSEELIEAGYNPDLNADCTGYVIVKNTNMGFKFYPYVKCLDYKTDGYEE